MNKTYGISIPKFRWDSTTETNSANPTSNPTRGIAAYGSGFATNTTTENFPRSTQGADGVFEFNRGFGGLDQWQAYVGKQKTASYKKVQSSKMYNPLIYGGKKFSPSDLPNLLWWFAGEDLANEFTAPNTPVERWVNRVTSQNDLTQTTSTSVQPTFKFGWNDFPCLVFDGVDDFMSASLINSSNQDYSIYIVMRFTSLADANVKYIFGQGVNNPSFRMEAINAFYGTAVRFYPAGANGEMYLPRTSYTPYFLFYVSTKNAGGLCDIQGAYPFSMLYTPASTMNIPANSTWFLGRYAASSGFFSNIEIYEIALFQQCHSIGVEIEMMKYYFSQKYKFDEFWI